jgi:hypothetical protein
VRDDEGRRGENEDRDEERPDRPLEIVRAVGNAREQEDRGSPVDREAERGEQAEERPAPLEEPARLHAVAPQKPAARRGRGEVAAGQDRARAHRDPGDAAADPARWLGEEAAEEHGVAQA